MICTTKPLILVTGTTQGIGLAIARSLTRDHSYHVICGVRNTVKGKELAQELADEGHEISVVELDLSSKKSIEKAVQTIERDYGYLDALINNAGVNLDPTDPDNRYSLYTRTMEINVAGPAYLTEGLMPLLRKAKRGPPRIVFMSSSMGSLEISLDKSRSWYNDNNAAYDASKAAINILALNFSRLLADVNAKVNIVCPGLVTTSMTAHMQGGSTTEEGAIRAVQMATVGADGPTATFSNKDGPLPW